MPSEPKKIQRKRTLTLSFKELNYLELALGCRIEELRKNLPTAGNGPQLIRFNHALRRKLEKIHYGG